jgi:hypothetical protein
MLFWQFPFFLQPSVPKRRMEKIGTMADNKFKPACHWVDIKMWSWHYVQLTPFSIFVILVIVTAIIKIKIGKRSVHQRELERSATTNQLCKCVMICKLRKRRRKRQTAWKPSVWQTDTSVIMTINDRLHWLFWNVRNLPA